MTTLSGNCVASFTGVATGAKAAFESDTITFSRAVEWKCCVTSQFRRFSKISVKKIQYLNKDCSSLFFSTHLLNRCLLEEGF